MTNDGYIHKNRCVSDLKTHLVLTTKYRRKVLTDAMLNQLHQDTESLLNKWDCPLIEFNGESNHVHMLFQYPHDVQLGKLVNSLKTVTSRKLRQSFMPELQKIYRDKPVLWNGSYFLASCGGVTISKLKAYIENQNRSQ